MEHSTFSERLAYARLLHHFFAGEPVGNAEIGRVVNHSGQWVTGIADKDSPPKDFNVQKPIAELLGVRAEWLFKNEGEPPRPEMWKLWIRVRRARPRQLPKGALAQMIAAKERREA